AGLPTNPENNYHSAVQPENTGRMVNRLPGRNPMTAVAFTINGKAVSVEAEPDTALLWVVREHLKLTGTKYGCGSGLCGACTVHIDGKAVRSCQTQMSTVVAPAIANALFQLTGKRTRNLPMSPERVKRALA